MSRVSSGTSVPNPRTSRFIGPRFTVSGQIVERSTVGAAGLSRPTATVVAAKAVTTTTATRMRRTNFRRPTPFLWISMTDGETHEGGQLVPLIPLGLETLRCPLVGLPGARTDAISA